MDRFTPEDLETVDRIWRALPEHHVWTGWAAAGDHPEEVWIMRTRANWRRFTLRKHPDGFALHIESDTLVETSKTLAGLMARIEAVPGLTGEAKANSGVQGKRVSGHPPPA